MPLPDNANAAWPPPAWAGSHKTIAEAAAWYEGDTTKLENLYGGNQTNAASSGLLSRFWSRRQADRGTQRQRLHLPAAADIAAVSADLLFGDAPAFLIPDAHNEQTEATATEAQACEDRLNELVDCAGIAATLLEAAEYASGLGGVYLRPVWNTDLADHPLLTYVNHDCAIPEFWHRQLVAVTFWSEVLRNEGQVWRHLERYEMQGDQSVILHGLYKGTPTTLGVKVDLAESSQTEHIAVEDDGETVLMPEGITTIGVRYVPNALDRRNRKDPVGRSDTAGSEPEMDALDETYSALMRDVRLAKARLTVPDEFLDKAGRGKGASFDMDQEVFSPLEVDPKQSGTTGIALFQPEIRSEPLLTIAADLFEQVARTAGYSPQSFGMQGDGAKATATEVDAREGTSDRTTNRKKRYWQKPVDDVLEMMLVIDAEVFGSGVTPLRPRMEFAEADADMRDIATSLNLLNMAGAVSTERKVQLLNPKWDDGQVQDEVAQIKADTGMSPDPFGAGPGAPPVPPAVPPPGPDGGASS